MIKLKLLQSASSLRDLSIILGFQPKAVSFILYKQPKERRYAEFNIPKKSGSLRTIHAPCAELKNLQSKLSEYLQDCIEEINKQKNIENTLAHGFKRGYSIVTNATVHRKRRLVLNIDLEDFFGSINFGRVRGFFIGNKNFSLHPDVATVLAQIICFDNRLPQGSPCSPVMSNLIGHILDIKLANLASSLKCRYSRYADDITFSTNKKEFPTDIVTVGDSAHLWRVGLKLNNAIGKCDFKINHGKTRLQYRDSRQDVTGLIVNAKVNTPSNYRKTARAMAHRLFDTGVFQIDHTKISESGSVINTKVDGSIDQLLGIFSYISMVNQYNHDLISKSKKEGEKYKPELSSIDKVHRDLLFFKHFFANSSPTIICEGKTDNVYLRCAIRSLAKEYPRLASFTKENTTKLEVSLFKFSKLNARLLGLSGGSPTLKPFISSFSDNVKKYNSRKSLHPVIILVDNDSGAREIFATIKSTTHTVDKIDGSKPFYYVAQGLYVVPTPKLDDVKDSKIEDFFTKQTLDEKLDGKTFNSNNEDLEGGQYGKHYFAEYVVKKNQSTIDFAGFRPLLNIISSIISQNIALQMSASSALGPASRLKVK